MNEDFLDLIRMSVLAYLGRDDDGEDCRGGLITFLEVGGRYDGSTGFLQLLDACLQLGAEWEWEDMPPWEPNPAPNIGNVYGFIDIDEDGTTRPSPILTLFIQKAFSTLEIDDEVSMVIRQLPSNLIAEFPGDEATGLDALYYDGFGLFRRSSV